MTQSPNAANTNVAQFFFDISALVKYYPEEAGTEQVRRIFASPECIARISAPGAVEIHAALPVKLRSGHLTRDAWSVG